MIRIASSFVLALSVCCCAIRAEEPATPKPDAPKPDAAKPQDNGGQQRGGGRGNFGGGGGGNFGGPGGIANMLGGGTRNALSMAARMLGIDIEDPKQEVKLDQLPLAASKRLVLQVPVGGVDNLNSTGSGWKMEAIFTMTPEQTKTIDTIRDEYKAEQKKLNEEILAQEKALALKVVELRKKFEQRATDVLTGADKESKTKLDALAVEQNEKTAALVAETLPLYDLNDFQQGFALVRALSDKIKTILQTGQDKLVELVPANSKDKIKELIKVQNEQRDRTNRFMQGGGRGRGGPGAPGGDAVKPPKAPEEDLKF